jgi:hypothetical protein
VVIHFLSLVLLTAAFLCFGITFLGTPAQFARGNLIAAGLALWILVDILAWFG